MDLHEKRLLPLLNSVSVFLADDHAMILPGLRMVVESDKRFHIAGEAEDGNLALAGILDTRPQIVVMDLSMPGLNGFDVVQRLAQEGFRPRVIILTTYTDDRFIRQALDIQVSGYILKDNPPDELLQALHAVADGYRFFTPRIMTRLLEGPELSPALERDQEVMVAFDAVTSRELEVIRLIAEGKKGREICASLNITESTLKTHKAHIMKKLNLSSTNEIIVYALRNDIFFRENG